MQLPDAMVSHPVSLAAINGSFSEQLIEIRPNQSLDRAVFAKFRALFIAVSAAVAGFSFMQGNWFAPFFAVVNVFLLCLIFEIVWRARDFEERVSVLDGKIIAEARRGERVQRMEFDPHWVRFEVDPQRNHAGALISHGIQFRLGGFLNVEQRKLLIPRMHDLLRYAREQLASRNEYLNHAHQANSL
jgi:uncharacterized membrane protein